MALLAVGAVLAPVVHAATWEQIRDRSAEICRNGDRAMQPHDDRAERAAARDDRTAFVRHARRSIRTGRPYVRRLDDLQPPADGRAHYNAFVDHTKAMVAWLDAAVDAIEARRPRRALRRGERAETEQRRAKRAARRYPLRRACIRFLS